MRNRILSLAVVLLALVPAVVTAQDSTSTGNTSADAQVEATLQTALDAGIPVSLLERKIAEGKAKGVPMERIAAAVEARLEALTSARDALQQAGLTSTTEGELSVAADAVQAGVSQTALAAISASAPQDRRSVALAVLAELVAQGRASSQAQAAVEAALARGPEALANLHAQSGAGARVGDAGVNVDARGAAGASIQLGSPRGN